MPPNYTNKTCASKDAQLYDLLEVSPNVEEGELKKKYKKLVRRFHPDKNPEGGDQEKVKKIISAYKVLSDPRKRSIYDEYGMEGLKRTGEESPSTTQQETPSRNQQESPSTTQQETPSRNQQESLSTTQQETPSRNQQETPSRNQQETPSTTQQESPSSTQQVSPSGPQQESPSSPQQESPSTTQQETPSGPQQESPSSPQQESPSSPQQESPKSTNRTDPDPAPGPASNLKNWIIGSLLIALVLLLVYLAFKWIKDKSKKQEVSPEDIRDETPTVVQRPTIVCGPKISCMQK